MSGHPPRSRVDDHPIETSLDSTGRLAVKPDHLQRFQWKGGVRRLSKRRIAWVAREVAMPTKFTTFVADDVVRTVNTFEDA
jgi:hypothetical protein